MADAQKKVLYFIRHAEPDYSVHDDMSRPLTPKGLSDAEKLVEKFSEIHIDSIYSSPYLRTIQTITPFSKARGLEINIIDNLRERKIGDVWIENFDNYSRQQWSDFSYKLPRGESLFEVQERNIAAVRHILSECDCKNAIIAKHGTALSTILNYYNSSYNYDDFERIKSIMPLVVCMEYKNGKFIRSNVESEKIK
jgi:2,3-bisphosphoglycerate-dependent phosphoglycerate mutase